MGVGPQQMSLAVGDPTPIEATGPQTCPTWGLERTQDHCRPAIPGACGEGWWPGASRGSPRLRMALPGASWMGWLSVLKLKHAAADMTGAPCPPTGRHQGSGTLAPPTVSPFPSADVVNLDLKSTLRVLYNLFTKYKDLE